MKNPNSAFNRFKAALLSRWRASDLPGTQPRFQIRLFVGDIGRWVGIPLIPLLSVHLMSHAATNPRRPTTVSGASEPQRIDPSKPQVIEFRARARVGETKAVSKRAPGTLVRVRLLNVVEAYSTAPVHVQIVDLGLGGAFLGGTLIGDGVGDPNFERMNITFKLARDPAHEATAFPIAARALSLNGTLGLEAQKKEGAFARAVYGAGTSGASQAQGNLDAMDLKSIVVKALTAGLAQEFGNGSQVEGNRAAVLTLQPGLEFFAELTDFFPSAGR
jgi:hypothetical protein